MNNRRKLVIALGASALAVPFGSFAQQQGKVWRVGYLSQIQRPVSFENTQPGAFLQGMREFGYVEGKNLTMEWRFASDNYDLHPGLAAELVRLNLDAIVTQGTPASRAVQQATATISIVMVNVGDPVGSGFAKSLARPGGNMTGLANLSAEIGPKQLEMLLTMVPRLSRVAVLLNPTNTANTGLFLKNLQAAGVSANITILPVEARNAENIDKAFSTLLRQRAGAVIVSFDGLFAAQRPRITALAAKHRLPTIRAYKEDAESGYLMSYGPNALDPFRRSAMLVDKSLKGAKPADLPVEQPTKFELFINGKTAKALGLKIPQALLIMADKMID